jgi:hypothetical protein
MYSNFFLQESEELEDRNADLREEIAKLEEERERLQHMLRTHDLLPTKCNQKLSICSDEGIFIPDDESKESRSSLVYNDIMDSDTSEVFDQVI